MKQILEPLETCKPIGFQYDLGDLEKGLVPSF